MIKINVLTIALFFTTLFIQAQTPEPVRIWQEPMIMPTYTIQPPDKNPMFYKPANNQGARKFIYPYAMNDNLAGTKIEKAWNAVYLENEYIKVCVLPEIGGRIFYATDKTNGYDFIYHQHVIKPANIGMFGAWISGGIEWCVFHHHRPSTFMPVDYTMVSNPDGSKTVWVGEIEPRQRMHWIVGITLHPGKSYVEAQVKFINRTALPHSMLYFANAATSSNANYQIIFPPSTDYATFHHKNSMAHWPIAKEIYNGVDYTKGVDISWWKNHPEPISFFVFNLKENFLGGYDHGKHAGTLQTSDHHVVYGAKFWQFGPGPEGQMWDKILTETDGPYVELMSGAYADNQPDYSWIKPYETRSFSQYWYPLREIGIVKNANKQASVNFEIKNNNTMFIGFNATEKFNNADFILKEKGKIIFKETISIDPAHPFVLEKKLLDGQKFEDMEVALLSASGKEIISYQPKIKTYNPELPEVVKTPPPPADIKTVEELYLTGLRIEQFNNVADPEKYYMEALKRDSCDTRVNTVMGIRETKREKYDDAARYFRTAISRLTKNYTRPRTCEALYQLGLVLKLQEKYDDAYDTLFRATWDDAYYSDAFFQLSEISCIRGDIALALEQINNALSKNYNSTTMKDLKCAILRKLKLYQEAEQVANEVITLDPLDFRASYELFKIKQMQGKQDETSKRQSSLSLLMRDMPESYLELAGDYMSCGFYDDALDIVKRAIEAKKEGLSNYPMIHYYAGYLSGKISDEKNKNIFYKNASQQPLDYCFPFRLESVKVLTDAVNSNPRDAHAHYLLGNNLFDWQPEKAIVEWEKAIKCDSTLAIAYRNLGLGYDQTKDDIDKAIAAYEKAIQLNNQDPIYFYELDKLYEKKGADPQKRFDMLNKNLDVVKKRMDSYISYIQSLVMVGQYSQAIELLSKNEFYNAEGSWMLHDLNVNAHLLRGCDYFNEKKFNEALNDFLAADEYPENQKIGRNINFMRNSQIYYFIGNTYEKNGQKDSAKKYFEKALGKKTLDNIYSYYQGLAYQKIANKEKADSIFNNLITKGKENINSNTSADFTESFGEARQKRERQTNAYLMSGLGYLGKNEKSKARENFEEAKQLDKYNLLVNYFLKELK